LVDRLLAARDEQWNLVYFNDPGREAPAGSMVVQASGTLRSATSLWFRALRHRYHAVCMVCPDTAPADTLALLTGFVFLLPCTRKFRLTGDGGRSGIALGVGLTAVFSLMVTALLLSLAHLVTTAGLAVAVSRRPPPRTGGRAAILIPILPDLSHTFVYREALEIKKRRPDCDILVLEVGHPALVHGEAAELMKLSEPVPRLSRNRYLAAYIRHWFQRPRKMAGVVRLLQPYTASFAPGGRAKDPYWPLRIEHIYASDYPIMGVMLAECLRHRGVSYVHVYGSTYPALRALVASQLLGLRFSLSTFADFDYPAAFHMLDVKLTRAEFVVGCTAYCRRQLERHAPEAAPKLRVLHHALPRDYASGKTFRPADGQSRLVYIGRFVPKKGLDTLIEACAILRDRNVTVSCHLYGIGEMQRELEQLVARRGLTDVVQFAGVIANEAIYRVMNHDDIFVTASRYMDDGERDGIPVAILEAMAAGITVVTTPVSGIPELIEHGVNGYLVPANDPPALAHMVEALVTDPWRRAAVSEAARRTVREGFALECSGRLLTEWIGQASRS
jgi:glycosyltransferase involved in cell wall biosynthesis